jgi:hypothetical protein
VLFAMYEKKITDEDPCQLPIYPRCTYTMGGLCGRIYNLQTTISFQPPASVLHLPAGANRLGASA